MVKVALRAVREILKPVATRLTLLTPASVSRLHTLLGRIPHIRQGIWARKARTLDAWMQLLAGRLSEVSLPPAYWKSPSGPPSGGNMDPDRDGCGLIWYPPLVPMKPDSVRRYVGMVGEICTAHGIEPLITLTSRSDRCFDSAVAVRSQ